MHKLLLFPLIISILTLTSCARHAQIIIDPQGVDMGRYQADLAECQHLAQQVQSKVATGIVTGAVIGTVVGKIIGGPKRTVKTAKLGALSGGLQAGGATRHERLRVIKNCLRNRGYQVLN